MDKPDLAEVLEHYGADLSTVSEAGWEMIICPFHADSVPSAGVNLYKQKYKCHRCEYAGDSIDLIREAEGLGFRDAIEWARTHVGFKGSAVLKAAKPEQYRPSWQGEGD